MGGHHEVLIERGNAVNTQTAGREELITGDTRSAGNVSRSYGNLEGVQRVDDALLHFLHFFRSRFRYFCRHGFVIQQLIRGQGIVCLLRAAVGRVQYLGGRSRARELDGGARRGGVCFLFRIFAGDCLFASVEQGCQFAGSGFLFQIESLPLLFFRGAGSVAQFNGFLYLPHEIKQIVVPLLSVTAGGRGVTVVMMARAFLNRCRSGTLRLRIRCCGLAIRGAHAGQAVSGYGATLGRLRCFDKMLVEIRVELSGGFHIQMAGALVAGDVAGNAGVLPWWQRCLAGRNLQGFTHGALRTLLFRARHGLRIGRGYGAGCRLYFFFLFLLRFPENGILLFFPDFLPVLLPVFLKFLELVPPALTAGADAVGDVVYICPECLTELQKAHAGKVDECQTVPADEEGECPVSPQQRFCHAAAVQIAQLPADAVNSRVGCPFLQNVGLYGKCCTGTQHQTDGGDDLSCKTTARE